MSIVVSSLSGWAGALLALIAFGLAFRFRSTALGVVATTISAPFCRFVGGYPILGIVAWAALIGNIVAACLIHRRRDVAFAALTPFAAMCVFLGVLAIRGITLVQPSRDRRQSPAPAWMSVAIRSTNTHAQ